MCECVLLVLVFDYDVSVFRVSSRVLRGKILFEKWLRWNCLNCCFVCVVCVCLFVVCV